MTTILLVIGILIIVILIYFFFFKESKISKTYSMLIYQFNLLALEERGQVVTLNKSNVKLFYKGTGQVIDFKVESNNDLLISWSCRYFQQEVVYNHKVIEKTFDKIKIAQTLRIVSNCIDEAKIVFQNHKQKIDDNGISKKFIDSGITNESLIISRDFLDGL